MDLTSRPQSPTGRMVGHIRAQAQACSDLGSPLYALLLTELAADVEAGGPGAQVLRGHEGDPGPDALAIRLLGGVHRLVLERRAPALSAFYPSVGGDGDLASVWPTFRQVLHDHEDDLRATLLQPPQTNEVGRAAALVGGLQHVVAWRPGPVRLAEIGASAGLNLRADHFRVELGPGRGLGPTGSPVVLSDAWRGVLPPLSGNLQVVDRLGCDTSPVDPLTTDGRLLLTSYVWADQRERIDRLRGAFEVAARVPARVETSSAAQFVRRLELRPGTTTVIWHSVMWQYLDPAEQDEVSARIEELGSRAGAAAGLAHLVLEPRRRRPGSEHEFLVVLRIWPGGEETVLGSAHPHGVPVVWSD